jgi:hypothetical protein
MSNAIIALANKVLVTYNTDQGWVVKKMKLEYVNRIVAILLIIYQKDKVQYFSNKSTMMILKTDHGEFVNWVAIMYFQSVKELIKWDKCQRNMIERTTKKEPKINKCHFCHSLKSFVSEVVSIRRSRIIGKEETCRASSKRQKKKR